MYISPKEDTLQGQRAGGCSQLLLLLLHLIDRLVREATLCAGEHRRIDLFVALIHCELLGLDCFADSRAAAV